MNYVTTLGRHNNVKRHQIGKAENDTRFIDGIREFIR